MNNVEAILQSLKAKNAEIIALKKALEECNNMIEIKILFESNMYDLIDENNIKHSKEVDNYQDKIDELVSIISDLKSEIDYLKKLVPLSASDAEDIIVSAYFAGKESRGLQTTVHNILQKYDK